MLVSNKKQNIRRIGPWSLIQRRARAYLFWKDWYFIYLKKQKFIFYFINFLEKWIRAFFMMLHQNLDVNCRITSEIKIQNSLFFKQSSGLFCICICVELIQVSINFCSFSKEVCFYLTLKQLILFALNPRILERYGIFLQNIIFVNKNRNQALNFNVSISIVTWLLAFKILQ